VSIELLLFVVIFVVLPLVQMLIKASQRDVLTPKPGQPAPRSRPAPRPRSQPKPKPAAQRSEAPGPPRLPRDRTPPAPPAPGPSRPSEEKAPEGRPAPVVVRPSPPARPQVMRRRALEPAIEEVLAVTRRATPSIRPAAVPRWAPPRGLESTESLRRAIVLAAILGPPRGISPHGWPGAGQPGSSV
jgi:hypothetical protein